MRTIASIFALLCACGALQSQPKSTDHKRVFVQGFTVHPIVFKDEGCARDYVRAVAKGGLEGRKSLLDQIEVGCVVRTEHVYAIFSNAMRTVPSDKGPVVTRQIMGVRDMEMEDAITGRTGEVDIDSMSIDGWMLDSEIYRLTREEMLAKIKKKR